MEILSKWRDAGRHDVRTDFEDAIAKAPGPKAPARLTFLRSITQTHGTLFALCSAASPAERGAILRSSRNAAISRWREGSWPSALGLQIAALNVGSRFLAGADAAYVLAESDKIIEEAVRTQVVNGEEAGSCTPSRAWCHHAAKEVELVCGGSPKRCARLNRLRSPKSPNKRYSYLALPAVDVGGATAPLGRRHGHIRISRWLICSPRAAAVRLLSSLGLLASPRTVD